MYTGLLSDVQKFIFFEMFCPLWSPRYIGILTPSSGAIGILTPSSGASRRARSTMYESVQHFTPIDEPIAPRMTKGIQFMQSGSPHSFLAAREPRHPVRSSSPPPAEPFPLHYEWYSRYSILIFRILWKSESELRIIGNFNVIDMYTCFVFFKKVKKMRRDRGTPASVGNGRSVADCPS